MRFYRISKHVLFLFLRPRHSLLRLLGSENHPHTKVYNGDVNMLLKHAIETSQGKRPKPLTTVEGLAMPPMPKRGEVDFIYGGASGLVYFVRYDT